MSGLTAWDWLLGGILFVSVSLGLIRGLVRTAFALASWVVALAGALLGSPLIIAALGLAAPSGRSLCRCFWSFFYSPATRAY